MKIVNPILKGFNADPSIIRVGNTFYIANSTFEWFPGVQIHKSKDLVNWELITHPLNRVSLLDMRGNNDSGGVWAPDLSYSDGKFWLVYTDVKVTEGAFKDCTNYLITADDICGPWSEPIRLNGVGFDASLFHDDDGKKYLVQMEWDHREYHHPFHGIKLTEYSVDEQRLLPETGKIIYTGTNVKLTEGPHIYKLNGFYYLFAAEGGTVWSHQEVVARSKELYGDYETQPETFLTAFYDGDNLLQKCGHGSLVDTENGEWYFAHLTARPWHHETESHHDPRGWCTLGRETAIQKVEWDEQGWPYIIGGKQGSVEVMAPKGYEEYLTDSINSLDHFEKIDLSVHFNTLRIPFTQQMGSLTEHPGWLRLFGQESLTSHHDVSFVARRWQAFNFVAETKMNYQPFSYQQMAGLANYYNSKHWSLIQVTWQEEQGRVIEITENNRGNFISYLKDQAIKVPDDVTDIYFRVNVQTQHYTYSYSFDGKEWIEIPILLDAAVLSDDYVLQTYGGFFTGAFVGLVNIDYSGYRIPADFDYFKYEEA